MTPHALHPPRLGADEDVYEAFHEAVRTGSRLAKEPTQKLADALRVRGEAGVRAWAAPVRS